MESIDKCLAESSSFTRAKREKVQSLIGMQDYDVAIELAKVNYLNDSDNMYHIHAYFMCVLKSDKVDKREEILTELIKESEALSTEMAKEMTLRFNAQFEAYINNNYDAALDFIEQAISANETLHQARLVNLILQKSLMT